MIYYTYLQSPVGRLMLTSDGKALTGVYLKKESYPKLDSQWVQDPQGVPLAAALAQFEEYFAGRRRDFDLPLAPEGTAFQQRVWKALREVDYGKTVSYGEIAARIKNPKACRAVGLANGSNPIPIIIPCHRIIGSNGSLTGYGGGLERKKWLLEHERQPAR